MLSNKTIEMYKQWVLLGNELDRQIKKETDEKFGFCNQGYGQIWVDEEKVHNVAEIEEVTGPLKVRGTDRYVHADFQLGLMRAVVLFSPDMQDKCTGGAEHDVCVDKEA